LFSNPIGIKSFEDRLHKKPMFFNPYTFGGGSVGGWVELGRTTLGSATSTIDVSSLADKRYYMILNNYAASIDSHLRLNADSGSNYAQRRSDNGGADSSNTSQTKMAFQAGAAGTNARFTVGYISNLSTAEKLGQWWTNIQSTAGAGTAPSRTEGIGKHAQTTNPIDQMTIVNTGGNFPIGSEIVVLGWDAADTHTTNFWEELSSTDLSGGAAATLDSDTFTAKKYLWVQCYVTSAGSAVNPMFRFNTDSGSNYAFRWSQNGGADATGVSKDGMQFSQANSTNEHFINFFVINNSSNEKLVILHQNEQSGTGAANAPLRTESVHKWANTSSQITKVNLVQDGGGTNNFGTETILKVWGSD